MHNKLHIMGPGTANSDRDKDALIAHLKAENARISAENTRINAAYDDVTKKNVILNKKISKIIDQLNYLHARLANITGSRKIDEQARTIIRDLFNTSLKRYKERLTECEAEGHKLECVRDKLHADEKKVSEEEVKNETDQVTFDFGDLLVSPLAKNEVKAKVGKDQVESEVEMTDI
ncbi:hypothetical protein N0V90_001226 [Kalmusia sp. IMI 367209]|nr:hypothetical protein N0V90_001226 [Kalmusia sp. IMI 367209]